MGTGDGGFGKRVRAGHREGRAVPGVGGGRVDCDAGVVLGCGLGGGGAAYDAAVDELYGRGRKEGGD